MDEILASIRKIIESNEPGMPAFPANDPGVGPANGYDADHGYDEDDDAQDIHLTIDDEALVAEFEAETRYGTRTIEPAMTTQPPSERSPSVGAPMSLADVAARVRAASERHSTQVRQPEPVAAEVAPDTVSLIPDMPPEPVRSPLSTSAPLAERRPEAQRTEPEAPVVTRGFGSDKPAAEAARTERSETPPRVAEAPAMTVTATVQAAQPVTVSNTPAQERTSIVSPSVGQQVARSFDQLAVAVDSSPRRSFDEIAQEMLRPMLQDWLDDNLPTLVERLVREEIERVARGPRR